MCFVSSHRTFCLIMSRKGDREVLLDLDYEAEAQPTESYGSLQNGSFIPPRYVNAILLFFPYNAAVCFPYRRNNCTFPQQP